MNPEARNIVPTATANGSPVSPKFMRVGAPFALMLAQILVAACGAKSETSEANGGSQTDAAIGSGADASADEGASSGTNADDESSDSTGPLVDDESTEGSIDGAPESDDSTGIASGSDAGASAGTSAGESGDGGFLDPGIPPALPKGVTIVVDTSADGGEELQILCGGEPCACSDGEDDDADGLVDGADSECTGPFDNDESTFSTGIPGDNRDPKWQDCFFDGNSGAGDDDCRYHSDCLTGDLPKDDPSCTVTQLCKDTCQPLTPPGCDCFGCCEIQNGDAMLHVLISDSCSMERIDDEAACPRCEPTDVCNNECGECEICVGQTLADLPESCFPPPVEEPPTGAGGAANDDDSPPGSGGAGDDGSGGTGNTPPDDSPPVTDGGEPPATPPPSTSPPNTCDGDAESCVTSDDCPGTSYCGLGCCHPGFVVR